MKKVALMIEVDARDDQSPEEVAKLLKTVINAGLSDALTSFRASSSKLDDEYRLVNPKEILDLTIRSPVLLSSLSDDQIAGIRLFLEKQPLTGKGTPAETLERNTLDDAKEDVVDPNKEENPSYWGHYCGR